LRMVDIPVTPPAVIPFGIRKAVQEKTYSARATAITLYSFIVLNILWFIYYLLKVSTAFSRNFLNASLSRS
jgi:hypothetical protein